MPRVSCQCGVAFSTPDEFAGRTVKCPFCDAPVTVPAAPRPARDGGTEPVEGAAAGGMPVVIPAKPDALRPAQDAGTLPAVSRGADSSPEPEPGDAEGAGASSPSPGDPEAGPEPAEAGAPCPPTGGRADRAAAEPDAQAAAEDAPDGPGRRSAPEKPGKRPGKRGRRSARASASERPARGRGSRRSKRARPASRARAGEAGRGPGGGRPAIDGRDAKEAAGGKAAGKAGGKAAVPATPPSRPAAPPPPAGHVGVGARVRRCAVCRAVLPPKAVVCVACGTDLRTGGAAFGGRREGGRFPFRAVATAVVCVCALVGIGLGVKYGASLTGPRRRPARGDAKGRRPGAAGPAEAEEDRPQGEQDPQATQDLPSPAGAATPAPGRAGGDFSGGRVTGEVELAGAVRPVTKPVSVEEGGRLRIGPGVTLTAAGPPEAGGPGTACRLTIAGGEVVIEGEPSRPAVVALPVAASSASSKLTARHVVFAREVALEDLLQARFERATFLGGLTLSPKEGRSGRKWTFDRCEFRSPGGERACIELRVDAPREELTVGVGRSNVLGPVAGRIAGGARVDLSANYWSAPPKEALAGLEAEGSFVVEPVRPERVAEAGAGEVPEEALALAGGRPAAAGGEVLANRTLGFEIAVPEGWRTAGTTMLLAPGKYTGSTRLQVTRRVVGRELKLVRELLISEARRAGARNLTATPGAPLKIGGTALRGLEFECTFDAGFQRRLQRYAVVRSGRWAYVVTLSGRAQDADALREDFKKAVAGFRVLRR